MGLRIALVAVADRWVAIPTRRTGAVNPACAACDNKVLFQPGTNPEPLVVSAFPEDEVSCSASLPADEYLPWMVLGFDMTVSRFILSAPLCALPRQP
jgi:hypothetical protein